MRCKCDIPDGGFCKRHSVDKSVRWVHLCQTDERYWQLWEAGVGPGQNKSGWKVTDQSRGLGDTIAKITTRIGIKPCGGCKQRQAMLNRLVPYRKK